MLIDVLLRSLDTKKEKKKTKKKKKKKESSSGTPEKTMMHKTIRKQAARH